MLRCISPVSGTERTLHHRQFLAVFGGRAEVTRANGTANIAVVTMQAEVGR